MADVHKPVMLKEAMEYLAVRPGEVIVDLTVGAGGHAREIVRRLEGKGLVIGVDIDPVRRVLEDAGVTTADRIQVDQGFCSAQMEDPGRGFSFMKDGPLDMRMCRADGVTAADIVNGASRQELARIISRFGEERFAVRIAAEVVRVRATGPIRRTGELATLVERVVPRSRRKTHPATRVFQALRIAVNREMEKLEALLDALPGVLADGGRAVVLTFHSLEDRLVKHSFQRLTRQGAFEKLTGRVVTPCAEEIAVNRRARSAKLRAIRKVLPNAA